MKKLISLAMLVGLFSSCKEEEIITPSVLVKPICCSEIYYGEIIHKEMHSIGDTIRIQYNQMPKHQLAYPNPRRYEYVTVVITKIN
jgi:hypothetical protein